ncbi:MAG: sensor histidine kinase, partial [Prevotella sp.]
RFYALQIASAIIIEVKDYDVALKYGREAWAMANGKQGDNDMRLRCIPSLALVFDGKGQTDSVFHYIDIGSRILDDCDNDITRIGFIQNRGDMCYRHQRWGDALRDMLVLTKAGGTLYAPLYRKIADCYRHLGDYRNAYCYMDSARMWTDSLSAKDIDAKLAEFNVKYKTKEREMQLAEERSQHAEQQLKWTIAVFVVSLLVVILVFIMLVVRHRHKLQLMFVRQCAEMNEARQYIEGLETERSRMARELHDSISNGLLGVSLKMQGAQSLDDVHAALSDVEHLRNEVRALSHGMMPPEFSKYSLNDILRFYVSGVKGVNARYVGCEDACLHGLPKEVAFEVFRIAQECMSNALTHSEADQVKVSLAVDEDKRNGILKVEDNGKSMENISDGDGIGIRIIQERVKTIGGRIDIQKYSGGTLISLYFPL